MFLNFALEGEHITLGGLLEALLSILKTNYIYVKFEYVFNFSSPVFDLKVLLDRKLP